jgi:hemoglobin
MNVRRLRSPLLLCATLACAQAVCAASGTLYDQIGGEPRMRAVVEDFTAIVLDDERINFTFAETDMKKFKQLLFEQLCNITQGPCPYTGRDMHTAHAKLAITNAMFNALAEDLYLAFDREHVPYRLQNRVMVLLAPMQHDVVRVGRGPHSDLGPNTSTPPVPTSPPVPKSPQAALPPPAPSASPTH